jgi:hypothetical protein
MKRIAAVGAAVIAVVVLILPAAASAAPTPTKAQFNALKNRVAQLERDTSDLAYLALYNECDDAWQWAWLDSLVIAMGGDPGDPYSDNGACAAVGITAPKISARSVQSLGALRAGLAKPSLDVAKIRVLARHAL